VVYGAFFFVNAICSSLGLKETLSPYLASQLANVIFIGSGVWLMGRIEK